LAVGPPGIPVKHVKADDEEFGEAMNKWTLKSLAAAVVGLLAVAGQANAAISYSYVTDAPSYDATPGQTVTVKLYLLETLSAPSTSLIVQDNGLFGFGVQVNRTVGDSLVTNYANSTDFPTAPNPKPVVPPGGVPNWKFSQGIDASSANGVSPNNGGANARASAVFLGSVDVTAGQANATFQLLPYSAGGGNSITNTNFYDLDANGVAPGPVYTGAAAGAPNTFTIVVPEPTFAGVAMVLGAAGMLRRRRQQA